jgi:hypothetical protein
LLVNSRAPDKARLPPATVLPSRKFIVRNWDGHSSFAWIPSPHHQFVFGEALDQLIEIPAAILLAIFNRFAELRVGQTLPDHRHVCRRQAPVRGTGWQVLAGKIVILMAGAASRKDFVPGSGDWFSPRPPRLSSAHSAVKSF